MKNVNIKSEHKESDDFHIHPLFLLVILALMIVVTVILAPTVQGRELREPPTIEYSQGQHEVAKGDCMYVIAGYYHVGLDALIKANPQIENPHWIYPQEKLNIPIEFHNVGEVLENGHN